MPFTGRNKFSCTIGETIYLTPKRHADYMRPTPNRPTLALLAHEACHVDQFRRDKGFKYRYVFGRNWRLKYESEAYARQIHTSMVLGSKRTAAYYINRHAKLLSSNSYLLLMSYDKVRNAIQETYNQIKEAPESENEGWLKEWVRDRYLS